MTDDTAEKKYHDLLVKQFVAFQEGTVPAVPQFPDNRGGQIIYNQAMIDASFAILDKDLGDANRESHQLMDEYMGSPETGTSGALDVNQDGRLKRRDHYPVSQYDVDKFARFYAYMTASARVQNALTNRVRATGADVIISVDDARNALAAKYGPNYDDGFVFTGFKDAAVKNIDRGMGDRANPATLPQNFAPTDVTVYDPKAPLVVVAEQELFGDLNTPAMIKVGKGMDSDALRKQVQSLIYRYPDFATMSETSQNEILLNMGSSYSQMLADYPQLADSYKHAAAILRRMKDIDALQKQGVTGWVPALDKKEFAAGELRAFNAESQEPPKDNRVGPPDDYLPINTRAVNLFPTDAKPDSAATLTVPPLPKIAPDLVEDTVPVRDDNGANGVVPDGDATVVASAHKGKKKHKKDHETEEGDEPKHHKKSRKHHKVTDSKVAAVAVSPELDFNNPPPIVSAEPPSPTTTSFMVTENPIRRAHDEILGMGVRDRGVGVMRGPTDYFGTTVDNSSEAYHDRVEALLRKYGDRFLKGDTADRTAIYIDLLKHYDKSKDKLTNGGEYRDVAGILKRAEKIEYEQHKTPPNLSLDRFPDYTAFRQAMTDPTFQEIDALVYGRKPKAVEQAQLEKTKPEPVHEEKKKSLNVQLHFDQRHGNRVNVTADDELFSIAMRCTEELAITQRAMGDVLPGQAATELARIIAAKNHLLTPNEKRERNPNISNYTVDKIGKDMELVLPDMGEIKAAVVAAQEKNQFDNIAIDFDAVAKRDGMKIVQGAAPTDIVDKRHDVIGVCAEDRLCDIVEKGDDAIATTQRLLTEGRYISTPEQAKLVLQVALAAKYNLPTANSEQSLGNLSEVEMPGEKEIRGYIESMTAAKGIMSDGYIYYDSEVMNKDPLALVPGARPSSASNREK